MGTCLLGHCHAIVIDILPLVFGIYLYDVDPAIFDHMRDSVFRFPSTGQSTAYSLFYGLSIWPAVSLVGLGVTNFIPVRSPGAKPSSCRSASCSGVTSVM